MNSMHESLFFSFSCKWRCSSRRNLTSKLSLQCTHNCRIVEHQQRQKQEQEKNCCCSAKPEHIKNCIQTRGQNLHDDFSQINQHILKRSL